MPSLIIDWDTPNVVDSVFPSSTYVYNLTANGFTAKHTSSAAEYSRTLTFRDADIIPTGYVLSKIKLSASFYGSDQRGSYRICNPNKKVDTEYLHLDGVETTQRTEVHEIDADKLIVGDGQHGVKIAYYLNSFSTYYCYFSGIQFELIYEADATKLFSGGSPVTKAYIGNTPLTGIYLGDTKLL